MQGLGESDGSAWRVDGVLVAESNDREKGGPVELDDHERLVCVVQMEGRAAARTNKIAALFCPRGVTSGRTQRAKREECLSRGLSRQ